MNDTSPTTSQLDRLRTAIDKMRLPLELQDAADARGRASRALRQIDDYIAPRLENLDAPLLAVVGGSTGAGKSTLMNALVGHPVTRTGAIRPTTRQPILLHHPHDRGAFTGSRVLPELARITGVPVKEGTPSRKAGEAPDAKLISSVVLVGDDAIPEQLALLDAPDVDSIADENRALAEQLLSAADLWIFVTTANRYADAVPWKHLDEASRRNMTVAVVLNRVPEGAHEVESDLRAMLDERGLGEAPIFVIPEAPLDELDMLPEARVRPLREWLHGLANDRAARQAVAKRSVAGAVEQLARDTHTMALARRSQVDAASDLATLLRAKHDEAAARVVDATRDGALLRTEVLARWQDYVGTSDVFRTLENWFGRARDAVTSWVQGKPAPIREVEREIEHGLYSVIVDEAGRAASESWQTLRHTHAASSLGADPSLGRESATLEDRAARLIRDWQFKLMQMIRENASSKRVEARLLSLGLNVVTVALMVAVFASTGGLTGGEVAIAGGSAVVGQKLLETVFGDETVRRLAKKAREDLEWRIGELFDQEYARYAAIIDPVLEGPDDAELDEAASSLVTALIHDTSAEQPRQLSASEEERAAGGAQ